MNESIPSIVIAFKTVTLLLGAVITYLAFKAYVRTQSHGLRLLALGFGVVTVGSLVAGIVDQLFIVDQLLQVNGHTALTIESGLTMVGFFIITYSLYETRQGA